MKQSGKVDLNWNLRRLRIDLQNTFCVNRYVGSEIYYCIRTVAVTADICVGVQIYFHIVTVHSHNYLSFTQTHCVTRTKQNCLNMLP